MSKLETPMTRWYWSQIGGTLVEEFLLTPRTSTSSARWVDGLIIPSGPNKIAQTNDVSIDGKHVISVQTKVGRLGMYLMGQVVFSQQLLYRNYSPSRVTSVALCERNDDVLGPMLVESFDDIEVVVVPDLH
jgi:hypothetical protein